MTESHPLPPFAQEGYVQPFTPVPLNRKRHDGWSVETQELFLRALSVMGNVGAAAKAVGMSRTSAYNLREREGAESFAAAWDKALHFGRMRQFDYAMERALDGVTTITVRRGGSVQIGAGPDLKLMNAALREGAPGIGARWPGR